MGVFGSKISAMDIPWLVKQLNECHLPVDRNQALDFLEQIDQNLIDRKTVDGQAKLLKETDGMRIVVKTGKKLVEDIFVITVVAQVIEDVKTNVPLVMDFIEFGGVDLLEKALRVHTKDDYLKGILPKLIKVVLAVGASACIADIEEQGLNLLLCHKCQETIERTKNPYAIKAVYIPFPKDRVNRVLRFMDNFITRVDVQIVGLDAVIKFCRNPDALTSSKDTEVFYVVSKCAAEHKLESTVLWRVAMIYALLASLQSELAVSVIATNVHEILIDAYPTLNAHRLVQQQILWMFGSLLIWQRSKKLLHKSQKSMDFFKFLVGDPLADKKKQDQEARMRQLENDAKSVASGNRSLATLGTSTVVIPVKGANAKNNNDKNANNSLDNTSKDGKKKGFLGMFGGKKGKNNQNNNEDSVMSGGEGLNSKAGGGDFSSMSKSKFQGGESNNNGEEEEKHNDDGSLVQVNDIEDMDNEVGEVEGSIIEVAIPVNIRAFIRETQGRLYREKKNGGDGNSYHPGKNARPRRNFNETPVFGTVSTRLFTPGEKGLIADGQVDEDGNQIQGEPEWNKHLNYGEEVDKETKKQKRLEMRKNLEEKANKMYDE